MKEPRSKSEAGGDAFAVANLDVYILKGVAMLLVAFDIGEERAIIAVSNSREMCRENLCERADLRENPAILAVGKQRQTGFLQEWRLGRQLPGLFVGCGQFARLHLAGLDIRLIEWIDAEDRTRDGRRKLPAEEFLTDVIAIGDRDAHDWLARAFECCDCVILLGIRFARQAHINEKAILPVDVGRAE